MQEARNECRLKVQAVCGQHSRPRAPSLGLKEDLQGASYVHHKDTREEQAFRLGDVGTSKERTVVQAEGAVCKNLRARWKMVLSGVA